MKLIPPYPVLIFALQILSPFSALSQQSQNKLPGLDLRIQVLDARTNNPIKNSTVTLKNKEGKVIKSGFIGLSGDVVFTLTSYHLKNTPLKAIASATGYEDKWSDIPDELLATRFERIYTIYLGKEASGLDKIYGPYTVDLSGWVPTGLMFKKGGTYGVQVTGKVTYVDAWGKTIEVSPDGKNPPWYFFKLKGKIGLNQQELGTNGGGYIDEDGMLELGVPRVTGFFPQDAVGKKGSWNVFVLSRDVVEEIKQKTKVSAEDSLRTHQHLEFLQKLLRGERPGGRNVQELEQEVKFIVSHHKMHNIHPHYLEWGLSNISNYHSAASSGNLTPKINEDYQRFLLSVIGTLKGIIDEPLPPGLKGRIFDLEDTKPVEKKIPSVQGPVISGKQLQLNKSGIIEGEKINVQFFNLPGNAKDWIAVSEAGKPENQYIQWFHTGGKKEGMFTFDGLPAGNYEARLFYNNTYTLEERLDFKVIANPEGDYIIKTEKTVFAPNEPIKVLFSNAQGTAVDWISITEAGKPDTQYSQWFHKGALSSGEMTFNGLPAGTYEVRYYLNNKYDVKKRIQIRVMRP